MLSQLYGFLLRYIQDEIASLRSPTSGGPEVVGISERRGARHRPALAAVETPDGSWDIGLMESQSKIQAEETELQEMVRRLVDRFHPASIYLFGSRATGTAGPGSDYDLLVVMDKLEQPAREYAAQAYYDMWGLGVSKDIVFVSRNRFDGLKNVVNSVERAAHTAGKVLYAR